MINGDTLYVSEDVENAFRLAGITHLLAVSGSNITFIIIATKFIFDKIFGKSISNFVSILTIILFVLICGESPSVVRSGLMAIFLILSTILSKKPHTLSTIFVTCLIMLLYNPFTICDVGFLLSFGGTLGIVLFNKKIQDYFENKTEKIRLILDSVIEKQKVTNVIICIIKSILETFSITLSAQIIIIPIMLYYFNTLSIVSFLTNLLVGPIVSIITIFGIAIYFIGLISFPVAKTLSYSLYLLLHIVIVIARLLSKFSFGTITIPTPTIFMILVYYLIVVFCYIEEIRKFLKYIVICFSLIIIIKMVIPNNYYEINMVDVGQGDCIHIKTIHKKNILIDGGGSENSDYDVGENVLVPYLLDNTNGTVDCIIISHFHEDHAEGCISVLNKLKVNNIIIGPHVKNTYLYDEVLKICKRKDISIFTLKAKDNFSIDGVSFEVLYPNSEVTDDLNNNSLILKATLYNRTILFTGDAEKEEEEQVLNLYNSQIQKLDVDILKVGHHGSRGSSTEEFLNHVSPSICLISCGVDNKFGHPHEEVLNRIKKFTDNIYRTDLLGEVSLKVYRDSIKIDSIY